MEAMKRTILLLSVLVALTAPASAAFLGANSPPGKNFLNTGIEKVAGDVNLEVPTGSGGSCLESAAEFFVAPGAWADVNEAMSARAAAYQAQITGRTGQAYVVNGTKFDGLVNGCLTEAKGPGYANFVRNGQFQPWFNGQDALVEQATRQLGAANGAPITWNVAEPEAATAIRNLFNANNINGINVVHPPAVP
jgi:filamentous hemagglutinin